MQELTHDQLITISGGLSGPEELARAQLRAMEITSSQEWRAGTQVCLEVTGWLALAAATYPYACASRDFSKTIYFIDLAWAVWTAAQACQK